MCVLRWDDTVISDDEVHLFLEAVIDLEDTPYASSPFSIARWLNNSFLNHNASSGLVCSALIEYAAKEAKVPLALAPMVKGPMLPATLVDHPWLKLIHAEWCIAR